MEGSVVGMAIGHTNKRDEIGIWEKGMDIKIWKDEEMELLLKM
jgi:hypothetical protein